MRVLYRGVCWNHIDKRWRVKLKHAGKHLFLGNYTDAETAARVWDCAARMVQGPNARQNFRGEKATLSVRVEVLKRLTALGVKIKESRR